MKSGDAPVNDIVYPDMVPFLLVHVACLAVFFTGVTPTALILCGVFYVVRMFGITAGNHRFFSHRAYSTSRWFQFVLAFTAQMTAQQGTLWWAAKHREHHKYSDTPLDVHSPRHHGFFFSHVGWVFSSRKGKADYSLIKDFTQYPELVWLDRYHHVPAAVLALVCLLVGGLPGLIVGFFMSTVLTYHCTFMINSLAHVVGRQRYMTGDDSRNNWFLAILTGGEGWHNNHHHFQSSTRQGFRWWEVDVTFYILKSLSWAGLVWDLKNPPPEVVTGERRLRTTVVERVAHQLANTFPIEKIIEQVRAVPGRAPSVGAVLSDHQLIHIPSLDELKQRTRKTFAHSPSIDAVALRARQIIIHAVSARVFGDFVS